MSWDFGMKVDVGNLEGKMISLPFEANYTYNVSPMFYRAFGEKGIRSLDGLKGSECLPLLTSAIAYFNENKSELEALNPPNGWGSYETALELLHKLRTWCLEAPNAIMEVA